MTLVKCSCFLGSMRYWPRGREQLLTVLGIQVMTLRPHWRDGRLIDGTIKPRRLSRRLWETEKSHTDALTQTTYDVRRSTRDTTLSPATLPGRTCTHTPLSQAGPWPRCALGGPALLFCGHGFTTRPFPGACCALGPVLTTEEGAGNQADALVSVAE